MKDLQESVRFLVAFHNAQGTERLFNYFRPMSAGHVLCTLIAGVLKIIVLFPKF
jgi:hypothetical protein